MHMDDTEQSPHHPMFAIKHINTVFQSSCHWDFIVKQVAHQVQREEVRKRCTSIMMHESVPNLRFIKSKL